MTNFTFSSVENAQAAVNAWNNCGNCQDCILNTPAYRCSYLYEQAIKYLAAHQ